MESINIIEIITILAGITGLLTLFNFGFNKRIDDLSHTFNKRIDDLKDLFKAELEPIKKDLNNHVTETDKKIDDLKKDLDNLKIDIQKVISKG